MLYVNKLLLLLLLLLSEMPRKSPCTDTMTDDTNVPTKDDKYPWLDPDDK